MKTRTIYTIHAFQFLGLKKNFLLPLVMLFLSYTGLQAQCVPLTAGSFTDCPASVTGALTEDGAALANVNLNLYDDTGALAGHATSDASGNYTISISPGTYSLVVDESWCNCGVPLSYNSDPENDGNGSAAALLTDCNANILLDFDMACTTAPFATISVDGETCEGEPFAVVATGGGTYLWNNGETTADIGGDPFGTAYYEVTVTAANGCVDVVGMDVEVMPFTCPDPGSWNFMPGPCPDPSVCVPYDCCLMGYLFEDINSNDTYDVGMEPVYAGITIELYDEFNNLIDVTDTDAQGFYSFGGLHCGPVPYTVVVATPPGAPSYDYDGVVTPNQIMWAPTDCGTSYDFAYD